jgi:hypothetical protein
MRTKSLSQLDRLSFIARIGIEKGKAIKDRAGEFYNDKNILAGVVTPDKK